MINIIAFILCVCGSLAQWNKNWVLLTVCAIFAVANLFFSINWIIQKIKMRKMYK